MVEQIQNTGIPMTWKETSKWRAETSRWQEGMKSGKFSEKENKFMYEQYPLLGIVETSKVLNRSYSSIMDKAKREKIKSNVQNKIGAQTRAAGVINQNFFDILGYNQGYILGFIFADGSLSERKDNPSIAIEIHERDTEVLEFIISAMSLTSNIRSRKDRPMRSVAFSTIEMVNRFKGFGLHTKKSKTIKYPEGNFTEEFHRGFISGFFDGDGSVCSRRRDARLVASFTSDSHDILQSVSKTVALYTSIGRKNVCGNKLMYYCGDADRMLAWLYQDGFHLSRKQKRFNKFNKITTSS